MRRVLAAERLGGRGWSDADLPLLDEARALLEGPPAPHGHVIVDEAQDLTPMQLRMLARRTTGAMTILGDIAQAAGPIALPPLGGAACRTSPTDARSRSRSCGSPTACRAR